MHCTENNLGTEKTSLGCGQVGIDNYNTTVGPLMNRFPIEDTSYNRDTPYSRNSSEALYHYIIIQCHV